MEYPFENQLFIRKPYSLTGIEKRKLFGKWLTYLTDYHRKHCHPYEKFLKVKKILNECFMKEEEIPMVPVGLFKQMDLLSVERDQIFKTLTSSGTSRQQVSKIYLDRKTAEIQQKALVRIGEDYLGEQRLPFLLIDSPEVLRNRELFSARGAGILGFSIFASKICYALDKDRKLDFEAIEKFLQQYKEKKILVFGFTYMIWKYFYKALAKEGKKLSMSEAVLIHGGGWKKLENQSVSPSEFKEKIRQVSGIDQISNYYGMAEQTGGIFMECACGHLHTSIFSDVITRRARDFSPCSMGEQGILQVLSPLPLSYPGHSILTEDEGVVLGEDDCPCGRLGKYFQVKGRIRQSEIRGCSDTYEG